MNLRSLYTHLNLCVFCLYIHVYKDVLYFEQDIKTLMQLGFSVINPLVYNHIQD